MLPQALMKLVPFDCIPLEDLPQRSEDERQQLRKGCEFIKNIAKHVG